MQNWKTTANGILAAIIGAAGPLTAYLATVNNPKAATASGIVALAAAIARVWVGILQNDAPPNPPVITVSSNWEAGTWTNTPNITPPVITTSKIDPTK